MDTYYLPGDASILRLWDASIPFRGVDTAVRKAERVPSLVQIWRFFKALVSPLWHVQSIRYYQVDNVQMMPRFLPHPALQLDLFEGMATVPDEVERFVHPYPGEVLSTLFVGKKVVGFVRAAFKNIYFSQVRFTLSVHPGEVYLYDAFLLPEYQESQLSSYLIAGTARKLLELGFGRVLVSISEDSLHSRAMIERLGFRHYHTLNLYRILGLWFCRTINTDS